MDHQCVGRGPIQDEDQHMLKDTVKHDTRCWELMSTLQAVKLPLNINHV